MILSLNVALKIGTTDTNPVLIHLNKDIDADQIHAEDILILDNQKEEISLEMDDLHIAPVTIHNEVDLHQGLQHTLMMVFHRIKREDLCRGIDLDRGTATIVEIIQDNQIHLLRVLENLIS